MTSSPSNLTICLPPRISLPFIDGSYPSGNPQEVKESSLHSQGTCPFKLRVLTHYSSGRCPLKLEVPLFIYIESGAMKESCDTAGAW